MKTMAITTGCRIALLGTDGRRSVAAPGKRGQHIPALLRDARMRGSNQRVDEIHRQVGQHHGHGGQDEDSLRPRSRAT